MRWIITAVAVLLVAGVVWFMRDPLLGLITPPPAVEPAPVVPQQVAPLTYASSTLSFEYPADATLVDPYSYPFGETKTIDGVAVLVTKDLVTGTNLSDDSRVSVEVLPRATTCTADIFLMANVTASTQMLGGKEYSVASSTDAGAGNLYEEFVFALPGSKPCTAVRYFLHSANIANFEPGAAQEFDRAKVLAQFDAVRDSLRLNGAAATDPAPATTTP